MNLSCHLLCEENTIISVGNTKLNTIFKYGIY